MKFLLNLNRSSFLIAALLCLCLTPIAFAQESTSITNVSTLRIRGRSSVPTGCSASAVVIYYDLTTHTLKLCQNGGAFTAFGAGAGSDVAVFNAATAPAALPNATQLWSQDSAAGDNNLYAINEAGKSERLTGLVARVSTQFNSTNQTPANITGLAFNVEAGKTYSFETTLFTTSDASGGLQIEISGTATATNIIAEILIRNSGLITQGRVTALDSSVGITAVTTASVDIRGTITVNGAGTLTIQAARNAAAGTTSVLVGSYFRLLPQGN